MELDKDKLKAAMEAEEAKWTDGANDEEDDRKRKYNSAQADDMGAEEMEAYHRTKLRADDPMANIRSDTLLDE